MKKQLFGKTREGGEAYLYTLRNQSGVQADISSYGGAIVNLLVPDRAGKLADVVLGYDTLAGYESDKAYLGAIIGRFANRIAHGSFTLHGVSYSLPRNNGDNSLHGGAVGFNKRLWAAKEISSNGTPALELTYLSRDSEEGYPGNLSAKVVYSLTDQNELRIDYSATTDKDTVLNLTNHSYFNLAGQGEGDILGHGLTLHARHFTPVNANLIPTGEISGVQATPMDFTSMATIGSRISADDEQLKLAGGYDHNWIPDREGDRRLVLAAEVHEPGCGRVLQVLTSQPGVQFYSGNFLDGTIRGKQGKVYHRRYGFCLETQHYPDSPNHPDFPSTELQPSQHYRETTVFRFSAR
ncbi:MAG TPA: aldose epimerase family protein [Terriglobales bacterium]|nr:aldose epimerase family protein [Terriglobales bacterium]